VLESAGVFHVIPTHVKDARGAWVTQTSLLDTPITLHLQDQNGHALLEAIANEVLLPEPGLDRGAAERRRASFCPRLRSPAIRRPAERRCDLADQRGAPRQGQGQPHEQQVIDIMKELTLPS